MIKELDVKYLDIKSYLEYEKLIKKFNGSYEELDKFFTLRGLPTSEDIKNQNLRIYISNNIKVEIYKMDEIKKD